MTSRPPRSRGFPRFGLRSTTYLTRPYEARHGATGQGRHWHCSPPSALVASVAAAALSLTGCAFTGAPTLPSGTTGGVATTADPEPLSPGPEASGRTPGSTAPTGSEPSAPTQAAPSNSAGPAAPTTSQPFTAQKVGAGRLAVTTLTGRTSGVTMKVWVWVPSQYDDPEYARTAFPVLMLFPGGDGANYTQWYSFGQPELVAAKSATGEVTPFIMVEPQMQLSAGLDTECTDLDGQPKVGTFLDTDVPAMVQENFRVLPARTAWGVAGASSGGYCAARLLFAHPDRFSVGVTLGGYFQIDTPLAAGHSAAAKATSPAAIASGANPPDVWLRAWTSSSERFSVSQNQAFLKAVRPPTKADQKLLPGGAHTWTTFTKMLPDTFAFFTEHLDKPSPNG